MKLKYIVTKEMLVKEYLEYVGLSKHLRKKVRMLDNIYINSKKAKNYYPLKINDILELEFMEEVNNDYPENSNIKLDIVYEDEYLLVINKPRNLSSQPSRLHLEDNVLSALKAYFIKNNICANIHLVNRLDYQTSGLLLVSKSGICHYDLTKQNIIKKYICEVKGEMEYNEASIEENIAREEAPSIKRYVSDESGSQYAKTLYKVLKYNEAKDTSILEVTLVTGRCHQIRVHMSYKMHPVIGDKLYNNDYSESLDKQEELHLHSYYLSFVHPFTNETLEFIKYPDWYN